MLETIKRSFASELEEAPEQSGIDYEQTFRNVGQGRVVKGRVVSIGAKEVIVDMGFKSEGMIPSYEFDTLKTLQVGDEVEVLLEETEDIKGRVILSKKKAE